MAKGNDPTAIPLKYDRLVTQGHNMLRNYNTNHAVATLLAMFQAWEYDVADFLRQWQPQSGFGAKWASLPEPEIERFENAPHMQHAALSSFRKAVKARLAWLADLAEKVRAAGQPPPAVVPIGVAQSALKEILDDWGPGASPLPTQIRDSVQEIRRDHPDAARCAFLMMRFASTPAHTDIVTGIREALRPHGINVLRADDHQYHADLFPNVQTYMHACAFGIAVFERLETEDFNPNVSLEVGYMLALGKQVCLLKDKTLKTLHTDLVGKIYRPFDPQAAGTSVQQPVVQWAIERGFIQSPKK